VFGLSFSELLMLLLVAVVVLGPKEMPKYLRKAGEFAGKLRRMAYDMRAKSGIDEVLRSEGIGSDIAEIRRLASFARGELGSLMSSVQSATSGASLSDVAGSAYGPRPAPPRGNVLASAASSANPTGSVAGIAAPVAFGAAVAAATSSSAGPAASSDAPAPGTVLAPNGKPATPMAPPAPVYAAPVLVTIDREREYPNAGADSYEALPETSNVYDGQLPSSPLAADPLYARGEASSDGAHAHGDDPSSATEARP
jgi:sec-independent protein translocase protein TatB